MKLLSFIVFNHYFRSQNEKMMNTKTSNFVMLKKQNPTKTQAWRKLQVHFEEMKAQKMVDLFDSEPHRFDNFSFRIEDLLFDYSKLLNALFIS